MDILFTVILITLILQQTSPTLQQQVSNSSTIEDEPMIICPEAPLSVLGRDCQILDRFNSTQIALMDFEDLNQMADQCACQLSNMDKLWDECFDTSDTRRVRSMVDKATANGSLPDYLWSDIDVTILGISIHTATSDFFYQVATNKIQYRPAFRRQLEKDATWRRVRLVCQEIAKDRLKLYRYLENFNRVSTEAFLKLIAYDNKIAGVYQASKACKILVHHKISTFKLYPDAYNAEEELDSSNMALPNDNNIDLMLKDSSAWLLNCSQWQTQKSSIEKLTQDCPMMMGQEVPSKWLEQQPSPMDRALAATRCGCQLLLHNATWATFLEDKNIRLMTKALINYLNGNRIPDFSQTPVWVIHGWFEGVMSRFVSNKKFTVKEMVKATYNDQDPSSVVNQKDLDSALESLRRGCNFIMFNHNKGFKEASELKLIKYLDNLQQISQDPMFVFHLTLQDPNLFKLHALSRMCQPVIR